jgi:hypothetical protein
VGAPFGGPGLYFNPPRLEKAKSSTTWLRIPYGRREDADLTVAGALGHSLWGCSAA